MISGLQGLVEEVTSTLKESPQFRDRLQHNALRSLKERDIKLSGTQFDGRMQGCTNCLSELSLSANATISDWAMTRWSKQRRKKRLYLCLRKICKVRSLTRMRVYTSFVAKRMFHNELRLKVKAYTAGNYMLYKPTATICWRRKEWRSYWPVEERGIMLEGRSRTHKPRLRMVLESRSLAHDRAMAAPLRITRRIWMRTLTLLRRICEWRGRV